MAWLLSLKRNAPVPLQDRLESAPIAIEEEAALAALLLVVLLRRGGVVRFQQRREKRARMPHEQRGQATKALAADVDNDGALGHGMAQAGAIVE